MQRTPQIRLIFLLTKNDSNDFDRDAVTQRLGINPSKSSAPSLSKGKLSCCEDICEARRELSGLTVLPAESPPFQILKHANWSIEIPKIESMSLDEPLQQLERILKGKECIISRVCKDYNLIADVIVRVFADSNNMPELSIPSSSICFWASMGVSIVFDFYLD